MKRPLDFLIVLTSIGGAILALTLVAASHIIGYAPPLEEVTDVRIENVRIEDDPPLPDPEGPPFFREIEDCGIDLTYRNGEEADHFSILEVVGGGVGLLDYDRDGKLDVFLSGGGGFTGPNNKSIVGRPCKLYRNLGDWKFQDATKEVGLEQFPWHTFYTHGVAVVDFDRDGWPDLLATGWGRVALFHNEPIAPAQPKKGRKFADVTAKAGLKEMAWTTSAAWADFDGDGYPDLYVCQYVDWSWDNNPSCHAPRDICPPQTFRGLPNKLFANKGDGTFRDVSIEAGVCPDGAETGKSLAVLAVDVNGDGKPDIYVCNDKTGNLLYINRSTPGLFRFEEVGQWSGTARDEYGSTTGSMGVAAADYDGCGRPSLWVTNFEREQHALYHNDCNKDKVLFRHVTAPAGIGAVGRKHVGWGTAFLDLDHHGWEDIVFVNGHVYRDPSNRGNTRRQTPVLLRNKGGGKFKNLSAQGGPYFQMDHLARGVGFGDLDNDGRIDAIVSHINEPAVLLGNVAEVEGKHWLGVELIGKAHADVVGAKLILECAGRTQTRFAKSGGSYLSSGDRRHVFGLGKSTKIDRLAVVWPNGRQQQGHDLKIDNYNRIVQE